MMKWRGVVAGLLFLVLGSFFSLRAQQFSSVNGVVSDKSGAVISGATVTLENSGTGLHVVTTTNDLGYYQFLRVTPADGYQLSFSKQDFRTVVLSSLSFGVSSAETHNARLEIGSIAQTVEVKEAGESSLNTTDATVGNVINSREVTDLPIQTRLNPASLMEFQPGVNDQGSVTGARTDQGNITLDGIDVNDQETGQAFVSTTPISVDSVQEIRTIHSRRNGGLRTKQRRYDQFGD